MTNDYSQLARENDQLRAELQRLQACTAESRQSECRLRSMFDNIHDVYFQIDIQGTVQAISPSIEFILKYRPEDLIGKPVQSLFVDPSQLVRLMEMLRKESHLRDYEVEVRDREGRPIYGSVTAALVCEEEGQPGVVFGVLRDINQRKQAEIALVESERSLYTLLSNLPGVAYRCRNDADWTMEFLSHGCKELTGYSPGDLLYNNRVSYESLIHSDDRQLVREAVEEGVAGKQPFRVTYRIICRDGAEKIVCDRGQLVRDAEGKVVALEGFIQDVTEEKQACALNARLAAAVEHASETIVITDPEGRIDYVNPAFERTTGYSREEVVGRDVCMLASEECDAESSQKMWTALRNGQPWQGYFTNRRKDGSCYREEAAIAPVKDESGRITNYVAVKRDISQEADLEGQLRQSQKMEAVGRLAGGVAHDFNNMLMVIRNYTEFAREDLPADSPVQQDLAEVMRASESAADLTRQLLAFSRRQIMSPRVLDLNELVYGMEKMFRRVIRENIRTVIQPGLEPLWVNVDPGQMEQVLMKLVINASEAMPDGGGLTVAVRTVELGGAGQPRVEELDPGDYVEISVRDTGTGMSEEVSRRVFEPFYTTKELGRGSGLGLSTVYGIVRQMHGSIVVSSELGAGTTFRVYLPRHGEEPRKVSPASEADLAGCETILIVEDQPAVRAATSRILERFGYKILNAEDGQRALELSRDYGQNIDLLVSDVVMPGMDGYAVAARMRQARPELKVILISGHSDEEIFRRGKTTAREHFLQKPFSIQVLARKVRDVLDE